MKVYVHLHNEECLIIPTCPVFVVSLPSLLFISFTSLPTFVFLFFSRHHALWAQNSNKFI